MISSKKSNEKVNFFYPNPDRDKPRNYFNEFLKKSANFERWRYLSVISNNFYVLCCVPPLENKSCYVVR